MVHKTWIHTNSLNTTIPMAPVHHKRVCVCVLGHVWLFVTLWTVAHQTPLSMGFSKQEHGNGLPCPPPGHFPDPGIELASLVSPALASGFFTTSTTWEAHKRVQTDTCTQMHTTQRHTHTHAQSNYEGLILLTVAFGSMLRNSASLLWKPFSYCPYFYGFPWWLSR